MERLLQLQGPIDCFLSSHFDAEGLSVGFEQEEEEEHLLMSNLEDKVPFLQMLQGVESSPFFPIKDPNFQTLLKFQNLRNHEMADLQSPVKSESQDLVQNPISSSSIEGKKRSNLPRLGKSNPLVPNERKKRKRARPMKNKEEVESQRMTHIAVERNRRRQMNNHLNSLRLLMPPSYVQRGDQASIIGGAIDFVKELEQLLQSLEAERRNRNTEALAGISSNRVCELQEKNSCREEEEAKLQGKSEKAEIEVTAVQNHVNLKIQCERRAGQLLRAIIALEDLRLTVLHLNITSSDSTVLYSFNLKIEEDCRLGSADEVAATVNQIFSDSWLES